MVSSHFIAPPAFQFYASDFLGSSKVGRMSLMEIGVFTLLLCHAWNANGLPLALPEIARMARMSPRRFERVWRGVLSECWIERKGRFVNPRQEEIRKALVAYRQRQRQNGAKGGRPRNPLETQTITHSKPNHKPKRKPKPNPEETSPNSNLQSTEVSKEQKPLEPHPVKEFLRLYDTLFLALNGTHPVITDRDGKIGKTTIRQVGEAEAHRLLRAFFASDDPFILKAGHGLNVFAGQINKLLEVPRKSAPRQEIEPIHHGTCPHDPKCGSAWECQELKAKVTA